MTGDPVRAGVRVSGSCVMEIQINLNDKTIEPLPFEYVKDFLSRNIRTFCWLF